MAELEADLASARTTIALLVERVDAGSADARRKQRALAESEKQLRRQNSELVRLSSVKSEFISVAAHELATPMTSIVGYLDLMAENRLGRLPDEMQRPLASLRRNAHRLRRLVDDMLDISRLDSGRVALRRVPTDIGELVRHVVDEARPLAAEGQQVLDVHVPDMGRVVLDPDRVHQVLSNLVVNAIKHTPPEGRILVEIDEPTGDHVMLRVIDSGQGATPDKLARLFEPFSTEGAAEHHTSGPDTAGMGLYIARSLVELHGGRIEVSAGPGQPTELAVWLPTTRD